MRSERAHRACVVRALLVLVALGSLTENARAHEAAAAKTVQTSLGALQRSDGETEHRVVARALDALRRLGPAARDAAPVLVELLSHDAALYQGRDKLGVLRLRAYVLLVLGEIGLPDAARPYLIDALAHVDERMHPVEVASAVRAAGRLGASGRDLVPYLLHLFRQRFGEEELTLTRYDAEVPKGEATTVQREIVRALSRMCSADDVDALALLERLAHGDAGSELDPRLEDEARAALAAIRTRGATLASRAPAEPAAPAPLATPWTVREARKPLRNLDIALVDHAGAAHVLSDLIDRPVLLTFFYSRCQNAGRCAATVAQLAALQRELGERGLVRSVRLVAVTFEPQFDTPERLRRFALDRGLALGPDALAVRLDVARHPKLVEELKTPVSYSAGWVNSHGIQAALIDAEGRVVRKYVTLLWDNRTVADDLQRLVQDSASR